MQDNSEGRLRGTLSYLRRCCRWPCCVLFTPLRHGRDVVRLDPPERARGLAADQHRHRRGRRGAPCGPPSWLAVCREFHDRRLCSDLARHCDWRRSGAGRRIPVHGMRQDAAPSSARSRSSASPVGRLVQHRTSATIGVTVHRGDSLMERLRIDSDLVAGRHVGALLVAPSPLRRVSDSPLRERWPSSAGAPVPRRRHDVRIRRCTRR